jgi:hypothetical protein
MGMSPERIGMPMPEFACVGGGKSFLLLRYKPLAHILLLGFPIYLTCNPTAPAGVILISGLPEVDDHQVRLTVHNEGLLR